MNNIIPSLSPDMIGQIVQSVRRAQSLTQADLALAAGVSTPYLSALENGKPTVRLDVLVRVLNTLNIQIALSLPDEMDSLIIKTFTNVHNMNDELL